MNTAVLTGLGRRAAAGETILGRMHLRRRGSRFRVFSGHHPVTVGLPAREAAGIAFELCGVAPDAWLVAAVIESAREG